MSQSESPNPTSSVVSQYLNKNTDDIIQSFDIGAMFSESPEQFYADIVFPNNSKWKDKDTLCQTVNEYARLPGFVTAKAKRYISCNRYGNYTPKKVNGIIPKKRILLGGDLKIGCKWKISYKALMKKRDKNGKLRPSFQKEEPIQIIETCFEHSPHCDLSPQGVLFCNSRSGRYNSNVHGHALFDLCMYQLRNGKLQSSYIKSTLAKIWPRTKNVSKNDVFSTRCRVKRLLPCVTQDSTYQDFEQKASSCGLPLGLDDKIISTDDEALAVVDDVWKEVLNNKSQDDDNLCTFVEMLHMMSYRKGFSYRIFRDNYNQITGAVWMTATMRNNFERFGHYISLDVMQRSINPYAWPYLAITVLNELKQVCVICESLMLSERNEAYISVLDFVFDSASARKRDEVHVISGDGFFDESVVTMFDLPKAVYIKDYFHLFDSILLDRFRSYYEPLEDYFRKMVYAETEYEFNEAFKQAQAVSKNLNINGGVDRDLEKKLIDFANEKKSYSRFMLKTYKGVMGRKGSSSAEQNHSSVLTYLNDGNKGGSTYCEELYTLVHDLFNRQCMHIRKWNYQLLLDHQVLEGEKSHFQKL